MLYLTCTTIISVDLGQCGVALAEDWVSVKCGTMSITVEELVISFPLDQYCLSFQ